jgi:hypothetical protein
MGGLHRQALKFIRGTHQGHGQVSAWFPLSPLVLGTLFLSYLGVTKPSFQLKT